MEESDRKLADEQWEYISGIAKQKYEEEKEREQSLIEQSARMQTNLSFILVAIFTIAGLCIDNGVLEGCVAFYVFFLPLISGLVFISFVLAVSVQWRRNGVALADIEDIMKLVIEDEKYEEHSNKASRCKQTTDIYKDVQSDLKARNNLSVKLIIWSMVALYAALGVIVIAFFAGIFVALSI